MKDGDKNRTENKTQREIIFKMYIIFNSQRKQRRYYNHKARKDVLTFQEEDQAFEK